MICELTPVAETVIVAILSSPVVFSVTVTAIVPLFDPVSGEFETQEALFVIVQEIFELISKLSMPAIFVIESAFVEVVKYAVAPCCVTVIYFVETPEPLIVTVAERLLVDVFALLALTVIVLLFEPLVGDTDNQLALSLTDHVTFELIAKLLELPDAELILTEFTEVVKYAVAPC